jgi:hypothetical protein
MSFQPNSLIPVINTAFGSYFPLAFAKINKSHERARSSLRVTG